MSPLVICIILNSLLIGYNLFGVVFFPPKTKVNMKIRIVLLILIIALMVFYSIYWTVPSRFRF